MKKDKSIDDIFKSALQDPVNEPAFKASDWDSFENMLDDKKGKGKVFWLPILGAVAAVLLAFFGWWMFKPQTGTTAQNTQQVANNKATKTPSPVSNAQQQQVITGNQSDSRKATAIEPANPSVIEPGASQTAGVRPQYLTGIRPANGAINQGVNRQKQASQANINKALSVADTVRPYLAMEPVNTNAVSVESATQEPVVLMPPDATGINAVAINTPKQPVKTKITGNVLRPQFALSVLAAPEVNGVGSFNETSKGTNIGLLFSVGLNKFSASTGATYSTKPYSLPFSAYHTSYKFKTNPNNVTADCRVLDIPLNIGYQVYNKSLNKVSIGTGISSYIMMHESYSYDYGDNPYPGPASYAVKGKGKYFFSIMNLQASYERKVASNVGLSLTPYLKLPLANIGYSQVKVQTFGVAVGLNWNINSLTKPK